MTDPAEAASLWATLKPDPAGLVTAVVQHPLGGQVLMVGHMNADELLILSKLLLKARHPPRALERADD